MLVQRGKKLYGYKTFRRGEKVYKEYLGDISSQASQDYIKEQEHKKQIKNKRKIIQNEMNKLISVSDEFHSIADIMMRYFLVEYNYYLRKSEIRRIRNED